MNHNSNPCDQTKPIMTKFEHINKWDKWDKFFNWMAFISLDFEAHLCL